MAQPERALTAVPKTRFSSQHPGPAAVTPVPGNLTHLAPEDTCACAHTHTCTHTHLCTVNNKTLGKKETCDDKETR